MPEAESRIKGTLLENIKGPTGTPLPTQLALEQIQGPAAAAGQALAALESGDPEALARADAEARRQGGWRSALLPAPPPPSVTQPLPAATERGLAKINPVTFGAEAVAKPVYELGAALAGADPALAALPLLGRAGRAGEVAERLIGASFIPGMAEGAVENLQRAREAAAREGATSPEALGAGTQGVVDAILAGLGAYHAFRPLGARPAPAQEPLLEGEIVPERLGWAPVERQLGAGGDVVDAEVLRPLLPPIGGEGGGRVIPPRGPVEPPRPPAEPQAPVDAEIVRTGGPLLAPGPGPLPMLPSPEEAYKARAKADAARAAKAEVALQDAIQGALQEPPAAPRIAEEVKPEAIGMRPFQEVVDEAVSRRMRRGEIPETLVLNDKALAERILAETDRGMEATVKGVVDALGVTPSRARRVLDRLQTSGALEKRARPAVESVLPVEAPPSDSAPQPLVEGGPAAAPPAEAAPVPRETPAPRTLGETPLDRLPEQHRAAAKALTQPLAMEMADTGQLDESALERLPPELAPHRDAIRDDAVQRAVAIIDGRQFLGRMREQHGVEGAPGLHVAQSSQPGSFDLVQRDNRGHLVGAAMVRGNGLRMIAGGRAMKSPLSAAPIYERLDEMGVERDDVLSVQGAESRRKYEEKRRAERAGREAVPGRPRADVQGAPAAPLSAPGPRVPSGPPPQPVEPAAALPAAAPPSEVAPAPAAPAPPRRGRRLPEPPKDKRGNPILPGQENWTPARREAVRSAARDYAQEAHDIAKGAPPRPGFFRTQTAMESAANVAGVEPGHYQPAVMSGLRGTPLEGLGSPKQILDALDRDRGNALELRALDAVEGDRRAREYEEQIEGQAAPEERDSIAPEEGGDTSFDVANEPRTRYGADGERFQYPADRVEARQQAEAATRQLALDFNPGRPGGPKPVSSLSGRGLRGIDAGSGVRTIGLAVTLPQELRQRGWVDLRGRRIERPVDLAVAARIFRDPRYETFRIFYTKGSEIVAHEAFTSRLPDSARAVGNASSNARSQDIARRQQFHQMERRMERLGADGYWLLHNHPSGQPVASHGDAGLTKAFAARMPGFRGHVIIDDTEFGLIRPEDVTEREVSAGVEYVPKDRRDDDIYLDPTPGMEMEGAGLQRRASIGSAQDLARIGAKLAKAAPSSYVPLIYTDATGLIRAVQEMPLALFARRREATEFIRGQQRGFGTGRTYVYLADPTQPLPRARTTIAAAASQLFRDGVLDDVARAGTGFTLQSFGGSYQGAGPPAKRMRVSEERRPYEVEPPSELGFFSQLRRAVADPKVPGAARGGDYLRLLTDPKRGVKADELKWTGLDDYLRERADRRVTKQEVQEFLRANDVQVKEVTLQDAPLREDQTARQAEIEARQRELERLRVEAGGNLTPDRRTQEQSRRIAELDNEGEDLGMEWQRIDARRHINADRPSKYRSYQLPGGENYREVLLTLPTRTDTTGWRARVESKGDTADIYSVSDPYGNLITNTTATSEQEAINRVARERHREGDFRGGHFDEPNVLAHIRLNDRTDAQGRRVLFVEEIQSDWAQKGRREGFRNDPARLADLERQLADNAAEYSKAKELSERRGGDLDVEGTQALDATVRMNTLRAERQNLEMALYEAKQHKIPSAPFVTSTEGWTNLALKRVLRLAAEEGYDAVAWTTGEQQAARYDLSKAVSSVEYDRVAERLIARDHEGKSVLNTEVKPEKFDDYIGKEPAERLRKAIAEADETADRFASIEGEDLKVGGEGMAGFYDKILPAAMGKLGKKWGAKVGETRINAGADDFIARHPETYGEEMARAHQSGGERVHSIPITPEMRRSVVQEGFSLFEPRRPYAGQRGLEGIAEDIPTEKPKEPAPKQQSLFGMGEMLQPTEAKTTEGREAEGPLFTQERDARARAEEKAQGGLFGEERAKPQPPMAEIIERIPGEEGTETRITRTPRGFVVAVWDTDVEKPLPGMTIYPTLERALKAVEVVREERRPYEVERRNRYLLGTRGTRYEDQRYPVSVPVRIEWPDGLVHHDEIKGLNRGHALARAEANWDGARITPIGPEEMERLGSPDRPASADNPVDLELAADRVEQPTAAQAEAGNYRKGHITWRGLDVAIETPRGGTRRAKDGSWEVKDFPAHYGEIKRTEGHDGDPVDVFIGPDPMAPTVWVIDQLNPKNRAFDEHKALLGFRSQKEALAAYRAAYPEKGLAEKLIGDVTEMPAEDFAAWASEGDTTAPLEGMAPPPQGPPRGPRTAQGGAFFDGDAALRRLRRRGRGAAFDIGGATAESFGAFYDAVIYGASKIEDFFKRNGHVPDFGSWAAAVERGLSGVVAGIKGVMRRLWDEARALFRDRSKGGEAAGRETGAGPRGTSASATAPRGAEPGPGARTPPPKPKGVPFVITESMRAKLRDLGYSERQIDKLRPEEAHRILQAGVPAGSLPKSEADRLEGIATEAGKRAQKIADRFEATNEKYDIAGAGAERVQQRGTIRKEDREAFRKAGQPERADTYDFRQSEQDIRQASAEMVAALKEYQKAEQEFRNRADPESAEAMRIASRVMQDAVKRWQVYRSAAGRQVQSFNRAIPPDVIQRIREASNIAINLKGVKERVPITTNIIESLKRFRSLTDVERRQLMRDLLDQYRLNLFSSTSFTLDLIGNAAELGAQGAAGLGHDLAYLARRGRATFPSLQGFLRTIRSGLTNVPQEILDALGQTAAGERVASRPGAGTFTYRSNPVSKVFDYLVGLPLYAKNMIDSGAKRIGAMSSLYRDAVIAADARGLSGLERRKAIEDFVNAPPAEAAERAVANGKKAGYDRDLSNLEERISQSTTARLFVAPFARWPFQFTRWMGEMVGLNPEVFRKLRDRTLTPEELGSYVAKTATGLGGLYLINQALYNRVDFNSMEYVNEDGDRVRLSNRDPLPTALWLLAVMHGDKAKATAALRYASVPFASLLGGDGGLLTSLVNSFQRASANQKIDGRAVQRELEDTINRAIPGQALLSAMKTVFDPTIREGIGANLPGYSRTRPAAVNPVTGEPLQPKQRLGGVEFPSIGGTPIPGATRILEPVQKLLSRFGLLVYRGPRQPIAGYPAGEMPAEMRREWEEAFGRHRQRLLAPMARALKTLEGQNPEAVRRRIQERDSAAARMADAELRKKYGGARRLPRARTLKEEAGPEIWQPGEEV